ncbi:FAR1-related sequence 5-like protein [Tanacetum coccineum]
MAVCTPTPKWELLGCGSRIRMLYNEEVREPIGGTHVKTRRIHPLRTPGLRPCQVRKAVNVMKSLDEPTITSKQYLFDDGSPIFWVDGRSRDAYLKFGDVVIFDVTYFTNKFKFPFALIVGVNHHGQSIIFGGALLENEKEETFKWLFKQFLGCMFNKCPSAIITDQDKAICNAVKHVFPNTRHRYCAWHIKKHVLEHLQPFSVHYSDFQEAFKQWVRSDTFKDFESQWVVLHDKYNLETSNWMMDIFVNSNTMLNEFVIQFDKAVDTRRAAVEDEDFKTMNSRPILSSIHLIEAKAGECYTKKKFELFQKEWIEATTNLTHETKSKSEKKVVIGLGRYKGGNASITIDETNSENRRRWNLKLPLSFAREVSSSRLGSVVFAISASATYMAATWASGTHSADVVVLRWLTWDPHADVAAQRWLTGGPAAKLRWSGDGPATELQCFGGEATVLGSGLDGSSRLDCMYKVPMIGSGSEPIIGLEDRSV